MNILLFGGYGTIGSEISKSLTQQKNTVLIIDKSMEPLEESKTTYEQYRGHNIVTANIDFKEIDLCINLAEDLSNDNRYDPQIVINNEHDTAYLLRECTINSVPVIAGVWNATDLDNSQKTLLSSTLSNRNNIIDIFNSMGGIITSIVMPQVIDSFMPINHYRSIFRRIMMGQSLFFDDEITSYIQFTFVQNVVDTILARIHIRSKNKIQVPSYSMGYKTFIGTILDEMDRDQFTIRFYKKEPVTVERYNGPNAPHREWFREQITRYHTYTRD